jgi:hypothetical protein
MELFRQIQPAFGAEEQYISATRESRDTMERLLNAEMARLGEEDAEERRQADAASERLESRREPV